MMVNGGYNAAIFVHVADGETFTSTLVVCANDCAASARQRKKKKYCLFEIANKMDDYCVCLTSRQTAFL